MSAPLEATLKELGYKRGAEKFRKIIVDTFADLSKKLGFDTDEDLMTQPKKATDFCAVVRHKVGVEVSDQLILRTLSNIRKQGGGELRNGKE